MSSKDRKQVRARTRRGKERQAWVSAGLKLVRDPIPRLCLRQELRRGPSPGSASLRTLPSVAGTCSRLQLELLTQASSPAELNQGALPQAHHTGQSCLQESIFPSIHLLAFVSFIFFLSKLPLGKVLMWFH